MENFLSKENLNNDIININNINSKKEKIKKIFEDYNNTFFCINENLARVMDITSRLFFFYTDCKDLNDIGKEFFAIDKYESYNYNNGKIFKDKYTFNLYDDLFQIKNSYDIFLMLNNLNDIKYNNLYMEIIEPFIPLLLREINNKLYI